MQELIGSVFNGTIQEMRTNEYVLGAGLQQIIVPFEGEATHAVGEQVRVFIFGMRSGKLYASLELPEISVGKYGFATIVREDTAGEGMIAQISSHIDVLVGKDDLPRFKPAWPVPGDRVWMTLKLSRGGHLFGKPGSVETIRETAEFAFGGMQNTEVSGHVVRAGAVGTHFLTEDGYLGFIHVSERKEDMRLGERVEARVIGVKPDGTLNASMLPRKQERMDDDAEKILDVLRSRAGNTMPYSDKSDPYDIEERFGMSKAAFKRALGRLMKARKIEQKDGWTTLVKDEASE
ncbi:MAG: hypothetical protein ACRC5C_11675 [Bacilli bacterium]